MTVKGSFAVGLGLLWLPSREEIVGWPWVKLIDPRSDASRRIGASRSGQDRPTLSLNGMRAV
jgi:hypothetical protein